MFTDLNRKTQTGIACIAILAASTLGLAGFNTFADRVKQQDLCLERQDGREAVRDGFVGTQGTLVRFSQMDVQAEFGIDSAEYRKFNKRASKYMITVRADALKTFPPVEC